MHGRPRGFASTPAWITARRRRACRKQVSLGRSRRATPVAPREARSSNTSASGGCVSASRQITHRHTGRLRRFDHDGRGTVGACVPMSGESAHTSGTERPKGGPRADRMRHPGRRLAGCGAARDHVANRWDPGGVSTASSVRRPGRWQPRWSAASRCGMTAAGLRLGRVPAARAGVPGSAVTLFARRWSPAGSEGGSSRPNRSWTRSGVCGGLGEASRLLRDVRRLPDRDGAWRSAGSTRRGLRPQRPEW